MPAKTAPKSPKKKAAGTAKVAKRANFELARGINAFSANSQRRKNGKWRVKTGGEKKVTAKKQVSAKKWYPADYIPKPLPSAKTVRNSKKVAKLRKSITPGTVLILLSGRFRGKRVVFLKQLPSGLLLVTGPYMVNGVPLRRVNQAYVIATSTKVDVSGVSVPEHVNDKYFAKENTESKKSKEEKFFAQSAAAPVISEQKKKDQKLVDEALLKAVEKESFLKAYLNAKFSLTKNDRAHELKF